MVETTLTYVLDESNGVYYVESCTNVAEDGVVNIPSDHEELQVVGILEGAFKDNQGIKSVYIGEGISFIGKDAFAGCSSLESIEFPTSLHTIEEGAFSNCTLLVGIIFPELITNISKNTFLNCESLASIDGLSNIISIEEGAFKNCTSLSYLTFLADDALRSIGDFAFYGCKSLGSITIPDMVLSIGVAAFSGCDSLEITLKEEHDNYEVYDGCIIDKTTNRVITGWGSSIGIKDAVVWIGDYAFSGNGVLTSIDIPNGVIYIGDCVFKDCTVLEKVTFGSGIENIQLSMFEGCPVLSEIEVSADNEYYSSVDGNLYSKDEDELLLYMPGKTSSSFVIPEYVVTIGEKAFYNNKQINKIVMADSVETIDDYAFGGCSSLAQIAFSKNLKVIGEYAFSDCYSLTIIDMPEGVEIIDKNAFASNLSLESINLPNSITSIGMYAFYSCVSLKQIQIPEKINALADCIFGSCHSLTEIIIPKNIQTVGIYAFYDCVGLKKVVFEKGIKKINISAFMGCIHLETIVIENDIDIFETNCFYNCPALKEAYFCGSKDTWEEYKQKTGYFDDIIVYSTIYDSDFIGFTFDGYHSLLDLNIIRVGDGDRFNQDLTPQMKDITAEVPNGNGQYYFGTVYPSRQFNINFAFDSLTEEQIRNLKLVFSGQKICDLIFDEEPYKVYSAKVTGVPQLKYIPFDNVDGQRVYKGEGTIQFTCYWPFAHTPNADTKISKRFRTSGTFEKNGLLLDEYDEWLYPTKNQWKLASGLKKSGTVKTGENYGDLVATFEFSNSANISKDSVIKIGDLAITLNDIVYKLKWDSKTGIVSGTDSTGEENTRKPVPFSGNSLGGIPVGNSITWGVQDGEQPNYTYLTTNCTLNYHYWYY